MAQNKQKVDIPKTPLRFFWSVTKEYKWFATAAVSMVVIAASISVYLRLVIENLVDQIQDNSYDLAVMTLLLYPVIFFLRDILWRLSGVFGSGWLLGVPKTTTDRLVNHASKHSHGYFSNRFAGSLSNKVSNVSRSMEEFVAMTLWEFLENAVQLLIIGVIFWQTDWVIGISFVGMVVFTIMLNIILMPRKRAFSLALANAQSKTTGFVVDVMSNMTAVRQFVRAGGELQNLRERTADVQQRGRRSFLYSEYMMLVNTILFTGFSIFSFIILSERWLAGEVSSGRLISFILLVTYISGTVIFLGRIISRAAKVYGQAEEGLNEIMVPLEVTDKEDAKSLKVSVGEICWNSVDFNFEGVSVFSKFNLAIKPKQSMGIVGPSGAGKTTFVSLLLRQHNLYAGNITIDGQDIATVTQDSLRQNITVVPQEPSLFHRTIRENILYGKPDATDEELINAAKKAQAHDFISELPDGYETMVGERGVKLSGGQKQRVAIARAILKDAPILVLDEATSALDSESEVAIQKALEKLMEGKTVIAVAHRLSTLRKMDRIIVLDRGKVIEDGSHDELASAGGTYQRLWEHQAGGFLTE